LNMFLTPLDCTSSSMPMICRFGFLWCTWGLTYLYFFIFFLCLQLYVLTHLSYLQALIVHLQFDPIYWRDFQLSFIWLTELFISTISMWFFSEFLYLYWISVSWSAFFIAFSSLSFFFLMYSGIHLCSL
jgi:hypothetical protein